MTDAPPTKAAPDKATMSSQKNAADPARSVWVSANAGSGKTYVLATRVIRLLLAGVDPSRILCLTYTKTAAAEMKDRVFRRLGAWVTMPDAVLREMLRKLDGTSPDRAKLAFARCLFALALETPGGLKIQTIHAFCDGLLHRFPLEANVPGHFEQMDEEMIAALIGEARSDMLSNLDDAHHPGLADAFARVIGLTGETGLFDLLDAAVANRTRLAALLRRFGVADMRGEAYRSILGFDEEETAATIAASAVDILRRHADMMRAIAAVSSKTGGKFADAYLAACAIADPLDALRAFEGVFLTGKGEPRSTTNLFRDAAVQAVVAFDVAYDLALDKVTEVRNRVALLGQIENTLAALSIIDRLLSGYENLKRRRGYLDFDDLIGKTVNLLHRPDVGAWVRYKLDQGVDHILVDEAQDTSPLQWSVIRQLSDEFFAGEAARDTRRTLFAVGDEKQSIYSFQGADPASFGEAGHEIRELAQAAFGLEGFGDVPLMTSFRSTRDVLAAVDLVFDTEANRSGVIHRSGKIEHRSLRVDQPGRVEVWEQVKAEGRAEPEHWTDPVDAPALPSVIVANRVAATIAGWIRNGEILEGTGNPVTAGDFLVLVRSRDSFIPTLSRALKQAGVDVAGADRLKMTDHIAVLDLLAIANFVLQPADDLSLAALLRSSLFDITENELFEIAYGREGTLFEGLAAQSGNAKLAAISQTLGDWRRRGAEMRVYEFYASILSADGGREKLIGRLGPETPDMIDEFMRFALAQEKNGLPSLQNFISVVQQASPVIKREMDAAQNQVRIMTVHGAKGLEAPVVFLIDRGSSPQGRGGAQFLDVPASADNPIVIWNGETALKSQMTEDAKAEIARKAEEEYRRLLYVGMTRAADRLIVAGYAGARGGGEGTWHAMLSDALSPHAEEIEYPDFKAIRYRVSDLPAVVRETTGISGKEQVIPLPEWYRDKAPPEPPLPRPLSPSGASGIAIERARDEEPSGAPSLLADRGMKDALQGAHIRRGIAMHRLLQMLPTVPAAERLERASAYCRRIDARWSVEEIGQMVAQACAIIEDPANAALFGNKSSAEAPIMGTIGIGGEERAVSGVIDRIAVDGGRVLLVDYKTNRSPPDTVAGVPDVYVRQMALYRALIGPLYPGKTVEALLLYTAGPKLLTLPDDLLDAAMRSFNNA